MASLFDETKAYIIGKVTALLERGETKLPTDHELAAELTASYATLRLVMKELERQGFIRRIRGSGTYLTQQAEELLADSQRKCVYIYTPPAVGTPDRDYIALLQQAILHEADTHNWKKEFRAVRSHREFVERLEEEADHADAVIYLPPSETFSLETIEKLVRFNKKPLIVIDCDLSNIAVNNITTDNRRGGMLAASHLLANGHRDIALLLCEPLMPQSEERIQGFNDVLEMAGLHTEVIDCHAKIEDPRDIYARQTLRERLSKPYAFTAIFAISDAGALGALQAFDDLNLKVGQDISLIGFDGIPAGKTLKTKLTTIAQPIEDICRTAIEWLDKIPSSNCKRQFSPVLRPGETVCNIVPKAVSQ